MGIEQDNSREFNPRISNIFNMSVSKLFTYTIIVVVLCVVALRVSYAKPASNKDAAPSKAIVAVKQFLETVYDSKGIGKDICYMDSAVTCSCPDGYYCCYYGDPSCTGACCPAGTVCGGPYGPCY